MYFELWQPFYPTKWSRRFFDLQLLSRKIVVILFKFGFFDQKSDFYLWKNFIFSFLCISIDCSATSSDWLKSLTERREFYCFGFHEHQTFQ